MLTATGYKCDLVTIESRRICNVGNLFSVSFSQWLRGDLAATVISKPRGKILVTIALKSSLIWNGSILISGVTLMLH